MFSLLALLSLSSCSSSFLWSVGVVTVCCAFLLYRYRKWHSERLRRQRLYRRLRGIGDDGWVTGASYVPKLERERLRAETLAAEKETLCAAKVTRLPSKKLEKRSKTLPSPVVEHDTKQKQRQQWSIPRMVNGEFKEILKSPFVRRRNVGAGSIGSIGGLKLETGPSTVQEQSAVQPSSQKVQHIDRPQSQPGVALEPVIETEATPTTPDYSSRGMTPWELLTSVLKSPLSCSSGPTPRKLTFDGVNRVVTLNGEDISPQGTVSSEGSTAASLGKKRPASTQFVDRDDEEISPLSVSGNAAETKVSVANKMQQLPAPTNVDYPQGRPERQRKSGGKSRRVSFRNEIHSTRYFNTKDDAAKTSEGLKKDVDKENVQNMIMVEEEKKCEEMSWSSTKDDTDILQGQNGNSSGEQSAASAAHNDNGRQDQDREQYDVGVNPVAVLPQKQHQLTRSRPRYHDPSIPSFLLSTESSSSTSKTSQNCLPRTIRAPSFPNRHRIGGAAHAGGRITLPARSKYGLGGVGRAARNVAAQRVRERQKQRRMWEERLVMRSLNAVTPSKSEKEEVNNAKRVTFAAESPALALNVTQPAATSNVGATPRKVGITFGSPAADSFATSAGAGAAPAAVGGFSFVASNEMPAAASKEKKTGTTSLTSTPAIWFGVGAPSTSVTSDMASANTSNATDTAAAQPRGFIFGAPAPAPAPNQAKNVPGGPAAAKPAQAHAPAPAPAAGFATGVGPAVSNPATQTSSSGAHGAGGGVTAGTSASTSAMWGSVNARALAPSVGGFTFGTSAPPSSVATQQEATVSDSVGGGVTFGTPASSAPDASAKTAQPQQPGGTPSFALAQQNGGSHFLGGSTQNSGVATPNLAGFSFPGGTPATPGGGTPAFGRGAPGATPGIGSGGGASARRRAARSSRRRL